MKEISLEELLKLQTEILFKVDEFCKNNSIPYTVFGGTCIGAVRHKGYIPWDDDIDIAMTRPNYDLFIRTFNGKVDYLEVLAPELNWNYYAPYANVCDIRTLLVEGSNGHNGIDIGVKIDVFPIDGVASNIEQYHLEKKRFLKLWSDLYSKRAKINLIWQINKRTAISYLVKRLFLLHKTYSEIQKEIYRLIINHQYDNAQFVDLRSYPWPSDSRCSKEVFEKYTRVPFENINVSIIEHYDEYLTLAYGDYMQLPPEEKRVPHHDFRAYWKD